MIIRRRTYIKQFTNRYGYFMRNTSFFTGISNSNYDNHLNSIYTKCMQEEVPVGSFNNRNSHSASCGSTMYAAVGYSDGTTIIVANARRLYRSTNGGATFQELCTWNSESYMSQYTGPIVYISGSYYYIVYRTIQLKLIDFAII